MTIELTAEEMTLITEHRRLKEYRRGYDDGMERSARLVEDWAKEANHGGQNTTGKILVNLVTTIRNLI